MNSERGLIPAQIDHAVSVLLGTVNSEYDALIGMDGGDRFDEGDVLEAVADRIARCEDCDVWCELGELVDERGESISCESCGGYPIA